MREAIIIITTTAAFTFKELFAGAKDSVVQVTVHGTPLAFVNNSAFAIGSGFVFDRQGHIVTNNHVVYGGSNFTVTFSNGTIYTAEVVGADLFSDIAVLKVVTKEEETAQGVSKGFIPLTLGNSSMLAIGDEVGSYWKSLRSDSIHVYRRCQRSRKTYSYSDYKYYHNT